MNLTVAIILGLSGILLLGAIVLHLDARNRRVQLQLSVALPYSSRPTVTSTSDPLPKLRPRNRKLDRLLRLGLKYEADAPRAWPVSLVVMISLAVGLAAVIIGTMAFAFWFGVIDGIVSGCFAARTLFGWQQQRYADRLIRQLPDAIQLVVSAVRAGLPVSEAFRAVAREMPKPTGEQFGVVSNEISLGRTPEEALRMLYQRVHVDEYAMFSVTLAVQSRAGGGLAETLETLGDTIRQRVALAGRAKALASQARLSARVLSCLPFLAGFGLYLERPDSLSPLFHDPRGRMLFAIGLTSLTIGVLTMRHMIKKGTTV